MLIDLSLPLKFIKANYILFEMVQLENRAYYTHVCVRSFNSRYGFSSHRPIYIH